MPSLDRSKCISVLTIKRKPVIINIYSVMLMYHRSKIKWEFGFYLYGGWVITKCVGWNSLFIIIFKWTWNIKDIKYSPSKTFNINTWVDLACFMFQQPAADLGRLKHVCAYFNYGCISVKCVWIRSIQRREFLETSFQDNCGNYGSKIFQK